MIFNFIKKIDNDLLHRVFASENYQTPFWVCFHTEDVTLKSAIAPVIKTWAVELGKVGTKNIRPKIVSFSVKSRS